MNSALHRKQQTEHRQRRRQRKSKFSIVAGIAGVLLIIAAAIPLLQQRQSAAAAADFDDADVARQGPFIAQHEMGVGPPIPFLPAGGPQPGIVLSETSHDFGRIGPTDVVERTFVLRNDGDAPLTISRAYTTCGCTTAEFSASVIPSGQVATVKVVFDAGFHDSAGQTVRRGIIIENNDPNRSQAEIWVQATVNNH